jgi:hypothetical protein
MAKLNFSIRTDLDPIGYEKDEGLMVEWNVNFTYDDRDGEILFHSASQFEDGRHPVDWVDFLKIVGKEADGDFVNRLYGMAFDHIELNLNDAYADYYCEDTDA